MLTDHLPAGDGLLSLRFIRELAARGHDLTVACEDVSIETPLPPNVSLVPLAPRTLCGVRGRLAYAAAMRTAFLAYHRAAPFDLAHQLNPVFTGLSLGLAGIDIPLVLGPYVSHWPDDAGTRLRPLYDTLAALQQHFAHTLLVTTPAARERIFVATSPRRSIVELHYGIDLDEHPILPVSPGPPTILFLAGLWRRKGIYPLLDAFAMVARRIPDARLLIAGDGDERPGVLEAYARHPARARIELLGRVARADVPAIIGCASVLCQPSFGEPYGMSVLEAMAAGRPVVATNAGGLAHLVDERGGTLVPPGDVAALALALIEVLENPKRAAAMGSFNRMLVESRHAWPHIIDRLDTVYASLTTASSLS